MKLNDPPNVYKSSVLSFHDNDCSCLVCRFIEGDRSSKAMLETIRVLDKKLADSELTNKRLIDAIVAKTVKK